jgi:hypothetical protein
MAWWKSWGMFRKLRQLRAAEFACLMKASALLIGTRILLPVAGIKSVRRCLAATSSSGAGNLSEATILRMLRGAARICPVGSTCLTRAITGQHLLRKAGIESRLCIGVMRDDQKQFQAHAWLEKDGRVILGGSQDEIRQWIPLTGADERTA